MYGSAAGLMADEVLMARCCSSRARSLVAVDSARPHTRWLAVQVRRKQERRREIEARRLLTVKQARSLSNKHVALITGCLTVFQGWCLTCVCFKPGGTWTTARDVAPASWARGC